MRITRRVLFALVFVSSVAVIPSITFGQPGGGSGQALVRSYGLQHSGDQSLPEATGTSANVRTFNLSVPGPGGAMEVRQLTGRFSPTLQAYFRLEWFEWNGLYFPGARLLDYPLPGSPLRSINISPGDIISRLDDLRIYNYEELERHYADTTVRWVTPYGRVRTGTIYIDADLITP